MASKLYDFEVTSNSGEKVSLSEYKDKCLLIVNTASFCGFTPQYKELEDLYQNYKDQGFEILAFPCNQFGNQEPDSNERIALFCQNKYQISFPLFAKVDVKGSKADPLFVYLCSEAPGFLGLKEIKWNFTKFLLNRSGNITKRFAPTDRVSKVEKTLKTIL